MLDDLEALTATHPSFCLAPALAAARRHADGDDALADIYELNLRTQLTIWGTSDYSGDSEVSDYANRQWSGLIAGFYRPRWAVWLQRLRDSLASGAPYDAEAWRQQCLALTYGWIRQQSGCPPGATDAAKQHQGHGTSRDMDTVMTDAVADDAGGSHTTPAADVNEPNRHGYLGSSITSHPAQAAVLQLHGGSSGFQPAAAVEVAMRLCRKYAACILATDDVADQ